MVCAVCSALPFLGLLAIIVGLIYVFLTWNFDYWRKRGVKGPKPTPFYGSFPGMVTQKRNTCYDMQDIYKQYHHDEDFVGVYSIRTPQLLILSPEAARRVYVTDFKYFHDNEASTWFDKKADKILAQNPFVLCGEEWKERRMEISPGLTLSRIKAVYPVTQTVCKKLVNYIRENCVNVDGDGVDAKDVSDDLSELRQIRFKKEISNPQLSLRFTSDVVSDCVLGVKADSLTNNPTQVLSMTKKLFEQTSIFTLYAFLAGLWPTIRRFYKAKFFQKESFDFFMGLMDSAFAMRRKQKVDRTDFLNYALQLQEKKNLSNEDLASHTMTFLLDGFETSASVIAHCLYQLAKKPSAQEKLLQEILENMNENGELDFEKIQDLPYLDQCLHESIRIIPPLLFSTKLCTEQYTFTNRNGKGVTLNPDDIVLLPIQSFHYDEQYFPNPMEFLPERFSPENGGIKKFRDLGLFYPFGDGPRICLGMKFALVQTKASIADIVKNFKVKLNPKTRTDNLIHPTYFIGALEGGVWLNFEERK